MALSRGRVDLIPPPQPDQSPARDVLQVVEVRGEEEHGDDEDEYAVEVAKRWVSEEVCSYGWGFRSGQGEGNAQAVGEDP